MKFFASMTSKLLPLVFLVGALNCLNAQYNPNSIYSRFGLGLIDNSGNVTHFGMGGITAPSSDPVALNLANPASYSFLEVTNLQATLKGAYTEASNTATTTNYLNGQVHELSMGFKKPNTKWGMAFGLTPYSSVDYRFTSKDTLNDSLTANYNYVGRGGINKATIGFSRVFRFGAKNKTDSLKQRVQQVSIGVNGNYLFGNISRENIVVFNQIEHYSTIENYNLWVKGIALEMGLQYKVNIRTRRDPQNRIIGGSVLQVGLTYNATSNLSAEYSALLYSLRLSSNFAFRDTTRFIDAQEGKLSLPQKIQVGFAYKTYHKKWGSFTFCGEYKSQKWTDFKLDLSENARLYNGLINANGVAAGIEYKPNADVRNTIFNRMYYRVGYRNHQSELAINGVRISQAAYSAGLTIPIIRSQSRLHLGVESGKRGTTAAGLVEEKQLGFMIGLSLTPSAFDRWFRQIKYD
jgi:hypothetical protein